MLTRGPNNGVDFTLYYIVKKKEKEEDKAAVRPSGYTALHPGQHSVLTSGMDCL